MNKKSSLPDSRLVSYFLVWEKVKKKGLFSIVSEITRRFLQGHRDFWHWSFDFCFWHYVTIPFVPIFSSYLMIDPQLPVIFKLTLPHCLQCLIKGKFIFFFASSNNHLLGTDDFRTHLYNGSLILQSH